MRRYRYNMYELKKKKNSRTVQNGTFDMKTFCQYVLSNTIKIFKLNMRSEIRYDYHALMLATWNLYFCSMRKFVNYSFKITSNFKKVYTKERRPLPVRQFILRIFNNTKNLYFERNIQVTLLTQIRQTGWSIINY